MDRTILHCDLNNFFASVNLLFHPELKGQPVAVCGSKQERHGIVLAKNEIAKSFGVKTAEPIWQAQSKCKKLVILPPLYKEYEYYSSLVKKIYRRYTDMVEPFGIDECWLDVTGSAFLFGDGVAIGNRIREEVKRETGLTISVGVSFNKVFAKLGSDIKKPDALTLIDRKNFKEKVWPLSVDALLFVGPSTKKALSSHGVKTIGDLTLCDDVMLTRLLGKNGLLLKSYAYGNDFSPVIDESIAALPKSIGRSETGSKDYTKDSEVWTAFLRFSDEISEQLRLYGLFAGGVQIMLKSPNLQSKEFTAKLETPTDTGLFLAKEGMKLFLNNKSGAYRSVGIRAVALTKGIDAVQTDIFYTDNMKQKQERLEKEMSFLRSRYGHDIIVRGRLM